MAGTARAYAEQFFDVLHRLHARYYLINVVIQLHARPLSVKDAAVFIRLYGLVGGRHAVDALLDYYAHPLALPFSWAGVDEAERRRFRQRLQVHVAILTRCLPERSVKPWIWELLSRLTDRLGREQGDASAGVRLDVSGYLAGKAPATLAGRGQDSSFPVTAQEAA
jgi:hypothetical protein